MASVEVRVGGAGRVLDPMHAAGFGVNGLGFRDAIVDEHHEVALLRQGELLRASSGLSAGARGGSRGIGGSPVPPPSGSAGSEGAPRAYTLPPGSEFRQVRRLLWDMIRDRVATASEAGVVRTLLGEDAVEENDRLFAEASAVAEILVEFRDASSKRMDARASLLGNKGRELLEGEVSRVIEGILAQSDGGLEIRGGSPAPPPSRGGGLGPMRGPGKSPVPAEDEVMLVLAPSHDPRAQRVFNYMAAGGGRGLVAAVASRPGSALGGTSRPGTGGMRPGTSGGSSVSSSQLSGGRPLSRGFAGKPGTSGSAGSRGSLCSSTFSSDADREGAVKETARHLNAYDIDKVKDRLREALREEKEALLDDIEFLQSCLVDDVDSDAAVCHQVPTEQELRSYTRDVEQAATVLWASQRAEELRGNILKDLRRDDLFRSDILADLGRADILTVEDGGRGDGGGRVSPAALAASAIHYGGLTASQIAAAKAAHLAAFEDEDPVAAYEYALQRGEEAGETGAVRRLRDRILSSRHSPTPTGEHSDQLSEVPAGDGGVRGPR